MRGGVGGSSLATAWAWVAGELAWIGLLSCELLVAPWSPRAEAWWHQVKAPWRKVTTWSGHWKKLGSLGSGLRYMLCSLEAVDFSLEVGIVLQSVQLYASSQARVLERQLKSERQKRFTERLSALYPGSQGRLHRLTKWRTAWTEPRSSFKTQLPTTHRKLQSRRSTSGAAFRTRARQFDPYGRSNQEVNLWLRMTS